MKRLRKQHVLEQSIYGAIWIVIFLLPLIGGYFAMSGGLEREETRMVIRESWLSILPFFVLFLLNNYGLVPYFLFKKRYWQYTVSLIFVIGMICWLSPFPSANHFPKDFKRGELPLRMKENRRDQIIKTREKAREEGDVHWHESNPEQRPRGMGDPNGPGRFPKPTPFPYPPFVLRYLIHFIIAFLMVGFNIAIKLFFKSFRDEEMLKELEHSKLMRYVLYEASNKTILLSREVQFLKNYIALMSLRYTNKVSIQMDFPAEVPEVQIPPLLFVSFVENAFKHGVSYRSESFIHVLMQLDEGNRLSFRCSNSNNGSADEQHHGIGLENIRKRLRLLFGNDYTLSITEEEHKFDVLLIIPLLE